MHFLSVWQESLQITMERWIWFWASSPVVFSSQHIWSFFVKSTAHLCHWKGNSRARLYVYSGSIIMWSVKNDLQTTYVFFFLCVNKFRLMSKTDASLLMSYLKTQHRHPSFLCAHKYFLPQYISAKKRMNEGENTID